MTEDPQTPLERLQAAQDALAKVRAVTPEGVIVFTLPPEADIAASVDGLVRLLIAKGVLSQEELVDAKTLRLAELTEQFIEQAKDVARKASGLILRGAGV